MRTQLFLFFIGVMVCTSLHGMESYSNNKSCVEIVIANVHPDTHRIFARLNRMYNKIIEEHYRPDKKRIEELMKENNTPIIRGQVSWNNNFSKCAWLQLEERKPQLSLKILKIIAISLCDQKNLNITEGKWDHYIKPFEGLEDLFFNKYGAACCYGHGYIPVSGSTNKEKYLEYSLNGDGLKARRECVVKIDDKSMMKCDLTKVSNIPAVMKAFLQSPYVYASESGEIIKLYNLADVIFPDEYKEKYANPQLWHDYTLYNSFTDDGVWDAYHF